MTEVKLAQFGMGMLEGTVVAWHKRVGDAVVAGELLADVEAAKSTCEIVAPVGGTLVAVHVAVDETVPIHTVLATIDP